MTYDGPLGESLGGLFAFVDTPMNKFNNRSYRAARAAGYRSGLETLNSDYLDGLGAEYEYEPFKLPFVQPAKNRTYTPDYVLPNGIIIDTKGEWPTADRQKFKMLKEQYPDLDIRMVFSNPNTRIGKGSKTTYALYATRLGIPYAKEYIPRSWINEPPNKASLEVIARLT